MEIIMNSEKIILKNVSVVREKNRLYNEQADELEETNECK